MNLLTNSVSCCSLQALVAACKRSFRHCCILGKDEQVRCIGDDFTSLERALPSYHINVGDGNRIEPKETSAMPHLATSTDAKMLFRIASFDKASGKNFPIRLNVLCNLCTALIIAQQQNGMSLSISRDGVNSDEDRRFHP
jgi:hypothetical protein